MTNKRKFLVLLFAITALCVSQAKADSTIVLTFEGLQNNEPIQNYYNGGLGGFGSGPGPNYGITFGADSLALISGADGGTGNFSGNPSGDTIAYFLSGAGDVMDVAAGFTTGFSFYYSAVVYPGSVSVYSGLDGSGTLLASLDLPLTPEGGAPQCTYGAYCPWFPVGVSFSGTAESVVFSGSANYIGFDDITLGSSTPGTVPEPSSFALLGLGLAGLACFALRRQLA